MPRKRGWGKGSIPWKNGAWEITGRPYRGAPQDPWTRLPGVTLAEAEARLDVMVEQVETGTHEPRPRSAPPMKVVELWGCYERHLQWRFATDALEQARVDDVAGIMRCHVLPAFGEDAVASIGSVVLLASSCTEFGGIVQPDVYRHLWRHPPSEAVKAIDLRIGPESPALRPAL